MKMKAEYVNYMPKELEEGILYISREYSTCAHLCACGCKKKVRTPLGETEWSVDESVEGPSLFPSVGNWQFECRSHYWIRNGKICWAENWSDEKVNTSRSLEEERRIIYFENKYKTNQCWISKLWVKIKSLFT